jgi:hypothetical protein
MKAERPLNVVFFKTEAGNEPVREWLKALSKEDCKAIGTDILTVQFAWPVGKPLVDKIVLLHGFIKKQQRTPQDELDLAKKRKKQYLQNL